MSEKKVKRNYRCVCGKEKKGLVKRPNCKPCDRLMDVTSGG